MCMSRCVIHTGCILVIDLDRYVDVWWWSLGSMALSASMLLIQLILDSTVRDIYKWTNWTMDLVIPHHTGHIIPTPSVWYQVSVADNRFYVCIVIFYVIGRPRLREANISRFVHIYPYIYMYTLMYVVCTVINPDEIHGMFFSFDFYFYKAYYVNWEQQIIFICRKTLLTVTFMIYLYFAC